MRSRIFLTALTVVCFGIPGNALAQRAPEPRCVVPFPLESPRCITLADCRARMGTVRQVPCPSIRCVDDPSCPSSAVGCSTDTDCPRSEQCIGAVPAQLVRGTCQRVGTGATPAITPSDAVPGIRLGIDKPTLEIPIPNLSLSKYIVLQSDENQTVIGIPWISQYIAAIYRFAVPFGAILAVIIIMIGGIMWLISGGAKGLSTAKEWITNAVIGLLLLVGSYVVLSTINPDLVTLKNLQIQVVQPVVNPVEHEEDAVAGTEPSTGIVVITGENIVNLNAQSLSAERVAELKLVASELAQQYYQGSPIQLIVTSGYRSVQKQEQLIACNCVNPPGSANCNPKPITCNGDPPTPTCILKSGPESCPHTTGRAVDVWGGTNGKQCITKKQCLDMGLTNCRAQPCQAAVIAQMKSAGYCNLSSEPWHFENPPMSSNCH